MDKIIEEFIRKLGKPDDLSMLIKYVEFCLADKNPSFHCEAHHILPRSVFPEYTKSDWNIVVLPYIDHCEAHLLLAKAYHIGEFIRPLKFMVTRNESVLSDLKEIRSISAKRYWEALRQNPEQYANKVAAVKKFHLDNNKPGMPFHTNNVVKLIRRYIDDPSMKHRISQKMKNWWKSLNHDEYQTICESRKWSNDRHARHIEYLTTRYQNVDFKRKFTETMTAVNKDPVKRATAGKTLKSLWQSDEYKTKTMAARKEGNRLRKEAGVKRLNSNTLKEKWADPVWRQNMLNARKLAKIRKQNETK